MTHLRRYLEQTGALPPEHLDMALRRQQIYGGSLDTVLLELELVDAHTLGELLVQACGLPLTPFELIDDERDRPWIALPDDVLDIGWAVPLVQRGQDVWIAVHPDLPNERLGALYRMVPNVNPFVIPECALEKIAAERAASVVPQRYAVLCVAYLSAMRRRPSVSDIGFPLLHDPGSASMAIGLESSSRRGTMVAPPGEDTGRGHTIPLDTTDVELEPEPGVHAQLRAPPQTDDEPEPEFDRRPTMVFEPRDLDAAGTEVEPGETHVMRRAAVAADSPPPREPTPERRTLVMPAGIVAPVAAAVSTFAPPPLPPAGAPAEAAPGVPVQAAAPQHAKDELAAPIVLTPDTTVIGGAPPVRFTSRGTLIATPRELEGVFREADLARRMTATRAALTAASDRDAVLEALAEGLAMLSSRVALLRVRNRELVGLATPGTTLPDPAGRVVPIGHGGLLARLQDEGRHVGTVDDETFAHTLEIAMGTPCLARRIDVGGRPTLVAYVDREGEGFTEHEAVLLDEICMLASRALEGVVKRRREAGEETAVRTAPIAPPPNFGTTAPSGSAWRPVATESPAPPRPPEIIPSDGPAPPRTRTLVDGSPRPAGATASPQALAVDDASAAMSLDTLPPSTRITEGYEPAAPAVPLRADNPAPAEHPRSGQMLTIHAMPPPPPLPPPPPMANDSMSRPMDTLMGLPPPVSSHDAGPRFVPPPLDERENSGIIPLSSPIDQPSMRGRIELDDEDWAHPGKQLASESMQRRVDAALRSIAAGTSSVSEIRGIGEPALLRLAAQFPGPLEVLRRDLRALPPPSAHGALVRTAIQIGAEIVPHLVDLFDHPSPDVRFYAAFVFQELRDPRAMRPLSELAFDTSGDVRVISMRVLETYSRSPGFAEAVRVVRAQLDSTNRTRQLYAARAVGTLRDIDAIPKLIDLLSSRDRFVQEAALESLCSITGQQLGLKPHRWKTWYVENGHRHRIEWIIDSLRHRDVPVRRWAADELTRVTGHREPFSAMGDKRARELAIEAWTTWWNQRGRSQLGAD